MITKILRLMFLVCCFTTVAFSQDQLTKTDGTTMNVKIVEVGETTIKYKKSDNLDGPSYSVAIKDVAKVKYKNGSEDVFSAGTSSGDAPKSSSDNTTSTKDESSSKFDINDDNTVRKVEALAKYAGESILSKCTGRVDNSTTEVFYDGVFQDDATKEITIPIKVSWQPRNISGDRKWIRGTIKVAPSGKKTWTYQNDSGGWFGGCAKQLKEL